MAKKKGRDFGFYVASETAPAVLSTPAGYEAVGLLTEQSYERARNMIDVSDADSGDDMDVLPGRRSRTLTLEGYYNAEDSDGQIGTLKANISNSVTSLGFTGDDYDAVTAGDFLRIDEEIVKVTAKGASALTVTRAQQDTTAASHAMGDAIFRVGKGQPGVEILHESVEADDDKLYFLISTGATGDKEIHGRAYVSAINFSAPDEGAATFSVTLQVVGKPAESVL